MRTIFIRWMLTAVVAIAGGSVVAQTQTATVGTKVKQTKVCDPSNNPVELPYFWKKNLMIFYVDPDHASQNSAFVEELEENQVKWYTTAENVPSGGGNRPAGGPGQPL